MDRKHDLKLFTRDLAITAEILRGEMSDVIALGYFEAMEQYSLDDCRNAMKRARMSCRFFPSPVELLAFLSPTDTARVESAWLECLELTKRDPWSTTVIISDPILAVTVRSLGGPKAIFDQRETFVKFQRKRFGETYQTYLDMARTMGVYQRESGIFKIGDHPDSRKRLLECFYLPQTQRLSNAVVAKLDATVVKLADQKRLDDDGTLPPYDVTEGEYLESLED